MPLGWIDFSKSERNKVLSVLDSLSEQGTLDELGIAPVRDGFSNLFFPGTSTIQTRAKYFLIVPYLLKDIERGKETNPNRVMNDLDEKEKRCGEILLTNCGNTEGIIGGRSLNQGKWVKRSPADIYWAGLRSYGIFTGGDLSLTEYVRAVCVIRSQKKTLEDIRYRNDQAEEKDDKDAGEVLHRQFWKIPSYDKEWQKALDIRLTPAEGTFLKQQIISAYPESMMAFILRNNMTAVFACNSFQDLQQMIPQFPEDIQEDYNLAADFSDFLYVLRVLYNLIVSDNQNQKAIEEWERIFPDLGQRSRLNLDAIIERLSLYRNSHLCDFLIKARQLMADGNVEGLKTVVKCRECNIKTMGRAKTRHPGEYDATKWFGGAELDYRFGNAKTIMRDIFESEGLYAESKQ